MPRTAKYDAIAQRRKLHRMQEEAAKAQEAAHKAPPPPSPAVSVKATVEELAAAAELVRDFIGHTPREMLRRSERLGLAGRIAGGLASVYDNASTGVVAKLALGMADQILAIVDAPAELPAEPVNP